MLNFKCLTDLLIMDFDLSSKQAKIQDQDCKVLTNNKEDSGYFNLCLHLVNTGEPT